ncbi:MAG: D-glucuronyl C5-epimerase family protein [Candidatus Cybelea sp.]|jgi:heparosan-N-sulfate-glucuronate 5-epimerase
MTALRRLALGFPITWSHKRCHSLHGLESAGAGPYFIEWDPGSGTYGEDWNGAPFDDDGVLLSGPTRVYHPIRIAQFALHRFDIWYATRNAAARGDFLAQAKWLRDRQHDDGVTGLYRFEFPWKKYGAASGWSSAMAQGEAISVLLRAHSLDASSGYGDAAERAAQPFFSEIAQGGVVWRSGSEMFLEEIANEHAAHVLNGCIFALWGVWELWKRTGDPALARIVEPCVDTLRRWLPRFDTGWWTLYSLLLSAGDQPHIATLKYHQFHIAQMHVLGQMFSEPKFEDAAQRWAAYVGQRTSRSRVVASTLRSLPERLSRRDTILGGAHT